MLAGMLPVTFCRCEIRVLYERAAIVICSRYRDEVCMFQLKP